MRSLLKRARRLASAWYIVPADDKWFTRLEVSSVVIEKLSSLDLRYPVADRSCLRELDLARASLAKRGK
jgi:hypothetical protein